MRSTEISKWLVRERIEKPGEADGDQKKKGEASCSVLHALERSAAGEAREGKRDERSENHERWEMADVGGSVDHVVWHLTHGSEVNSDARWRSQTRRRAR